MLKTHFVLNITRNSQSNKYEANGQSSMLKHLLCVGSNFQWRTIMLSNTHVKIMCKISPISPLCLNGLSAASQIVLNRHCLPFNPKL